MPNGDAGIDDVCNVFMSYRRSDDPNFTGRFHDKLIGVFGESNVFRDIDSLSAGTRFADVITESLDHVDAVVALIGPTWVGRLQSPTDFVRMEISHALRAGKPVVPVLIEDTPMPETAALPEDMQSLLAINAVRVRRDPDFHRDAARVIAGIRESVRVAQEQQERIRRETEAAQAERARQAAEQERIDAEKRAAENQAREAALRRQLQDELVRAEAEEAERRRATEALERERLERLAELARLEEEATRRQIADERARLAAIDEVKLRRDEELLAAQARSRELRELLQGPAPLGHAAAEVINRPLPPPQVLPPAAPPEVRPEPVVAAVPAPTRPRTRHWVASRPRYVVGAVFLVAAAFFGIGALSATDYGSLTPLSWGTSSDIGAWLLTLGLFAPLFARTVSDTGAITTGVAIGYLAYQALTDVQWVWGVHEGPAWYDYRTAVVIVGALLLGARVMFRDATERDARSWVPRVRARVALIALAVGINVVLVIYLGRWYDHYREDNTDTDVFVSPGVQLPRLASLLLVPSVLLVVWSLRRTRAAAVALVALASVAGVAYLTAAFDVGGSESGTAARGEFIFAAAAAAAIVGTTVRSLAGRKPAHRAGL